MYWKFQIIDLLYFSMCARLYFLNIWQRRLWRPRKGTLGGPGYDGLSVTWLGKFKEIHQIVGWTDRVSLMGSKVESASLRHDPEFDSLLILNLREEKPIRRQSELHVAPYISHYIGGNDAITISRGRNVHDPRHVPWQAGIRRKTRTGTRHHCGVTIISHSQILTAAHCFYLWSNAADFSVRVGDLDKTLLEPDEQEFDVLRILIHPLFKARPLGTFDYDIAIVVVRPINGQPIQYNDNVQRAYLPSRQLQIVPRSECYSSGWGRTSSGKESDILQVGRTDVLDHAGQITCNERYLGLITDRMICAGYLDGTAIDTCDGDSGGPLVCKINGRNAVVGVTSWGSGDCAARGYPGVYANVQEMLDWIYNPS